MRSFGQVPTVLWRTPAFVKLSDDAKLALMFLYSGPSSSSSGVFWLEDGVAASILKWDVNRWIAARIALIDKGFIKCSEETAECFVLDYLKTNRPKNKAAWEAVEKQINATICLNLRAAVKAVYEQVLNGSEEASLGTDDQRNVVMTEEKTAVGDLGQISEVQQALDAYNKMAEKTGLATAQRLTDVRRKQLTSRLRECGGLDGWTVAMEKVAASDFLTGKVKAWSADLDFILKASSFTKIMEGAYDNKLAPKQKEARYYPQDALRDLYAKNCEPENGVGSPNSWTDVLGETPPI